MSPRDQTEILCMEAANLVTGSNFKERKDICRRKEGAAVQVNDTFEGSCGSIEVRKTFVGHSLGKESDRSKRKERKRSNISQAIKESTDDFCQFSESENSPEYLCGKDIEIQTRNMDLLQQTHFYYDCMTSQQAKSLLAKCENGTFLIRDSADPNFLFSVSVKTARGPTSVRVLYSNGRFQLDCDSKIRTVVPKFETVVALVDYYVRIGYNEKNKCRWLESSGRKDLPIVLKKPKVNTISDLKHLCRLTINKNLPIVQKRSDIFSNIDKLELPRPLAEYVKYYPHLN